MKKRKLQKGLHSSHRQLNALLYNGLSTWRPVSGLHKSSQVFTGLHGKVSYFRFSQLKSENGKGVMRREEMWRGKLPLHANNLLLISEICRACEEWRPNLSICKREIFFPHEGKIKTSRGKNNDKLLAYRNSSKYRSNLNSHENLGVSYR